MANRRQLASSSSAMSAMFTRSRSEIFLHRTRSGRARPDPKRRQPAPAPAPPLRDGPQNSVKDLRLKRVFSDHKAKTKTETDDDYRADEKRSGSDDFEIAKGSSNDSDQDSMQTTTQNLDEASEYDGVRVSEETNLGNLPKNKPRLWPCSRSKLIGNSSSFSYRRLLPYLKDLAKDGSSGLEIIQAHNCGLPKVGKPMEESRLLNPSSEQQNHDVPLVDSTMVNSGGDHDFKENPVLEAPSPNSHQDIVHKPMKVESPSSCCESKLLIPGVTSNVGFNDKNTDELDRQEQEAADKERNGSDVEILKVSDDCSGDVVESTPPDAELATKFDGAELGRKRTISEPGLSSMSKNSSGPALCSRSKLYRNPSSFSYRRLLPYLMDLAKNASSGMEPIHSQNGTIKVEASMQENALILNSIPLPTQQHQTVPPEDSSYVYSREKLDFEVNHVSEKPGLDSQGDIHNSVTTEVPKSCNMSQVQVLGVTSEIPLEKSDFEFEMESKSSFCALTISEALSVEELASTMPELSYSQMETDMIPKQNASQFKVFGDAAKQALAPRKSILKKQSRGCKGICMCLECITFRVHAERAYEFSRRQMSDADEVVERLLKELSHLRNLMEGSAVPVVDGAESYTVIQVNQDQLKGVCQRALRVEELAKSRMRQMFCDLNIHCRIPGPRVSFSDYVNERNIS